MLIVALAGIVIVLASLLVGRGDAWTITWLFPGALPKSVIGILLGVVVVLVGIGLWKIPQVQAAAVPGLDAKDRFQTENSARTTLAQIVGGAALFVGFWSTAETLQAGQENIRVAQAGQITDRFTKAIEQVGSERDDESQGRDTRVLGGIYALERITKDSPGDQWTVMEVLTTYVRRRAGLTVPTRLAKDDCGEKGARERRPDIQAILTVIGRRTLSEDYPEPDDLLLRQTDLSEYRVPYALLNRANLWGSDLYRTFLEGAQLQQAFLHDACLWHTHLVRANLTDAVLTNANLTDAVLTNAMLERARLCNAVLSGAKLSGASLKDARLDGADLRNVDLTGVAGLTSQQIELAKRDDSTLLPDLRPSDSPPPRGCA